MRELEHRQRLKRRLYSLPALVLLLIITVALVRGTYFLVLKERETAQEAEALALRAKSLAEREQTLLKETSKLGTESGVEEEIKSKFNVAREGERVAVIVDRPQLESATTTEDLPWWKRFWNAIISR